MKGKRSDNKNFDRAGTAKENVENSITAANTLLKSSDKHKVVSIQKLTVPLTEEKLVGGGLGLRRGCSLIWVG